MLHSGFPTSHRSALAKFRCGVAPLKIETGRYEGLEVEERVCFNCCSAVENETHVLFECPIYDDLRFYLFKEVEFFYNDFNILSTTEKLCVV